MAWLDKGIGDVDVLDELEFGIFTLFGSLLIGVLALYPGITFDRSGLSNSVGDMLCTLEDAWPVRVRRGSKSETSNERDKRLEVIPSWIISTCRKIGAVILIPRICEYSLGLHGTRRSYTTPLISEWDGDRRE